MREIKFRAWDKLDGMKYFDLDDLYYKRLTVNHGVYDVPIMQYTGLKDKNGKEIYEGDLWKRKLYFDESRPPKNKPFIEVVTPIIYQHGVFEPDDRNVRRYPYSTTYNDWWDQGEVIGNIYENKELLP